VAFSEWKPCAPFALPNSNFFCYLQTLSTEFCLEFAPQLLSSVVQVMDTANGSASEPDSESSKWSPIPVWKESDSNDSTELSKFNASRVYDEPDCKAVRNEIEGQAKSSIAPVYDNFYSPQNQTFYAQSPYEYLDATEHQIRLLKPLPLGNDGIPSFTLLDNCPLDSVRSCYTALSYCAGDPKQTEAINVNGAKFNAFANLSYA
jgi:hypothetical protein